MPDARHPERERPRSAGKEAGDRVAGRRRRGGPPQVRAALERLAVARALVAVYVAVRAAPLDTLRHWAGLPDEEMLAEVSMLAFWIGQAPDDADEVERTLRWIDRLLRLPAVDAAAL